MKSKSDSQTPSTDMPTHLKEVDTENTKWNEKDDAYWKEALTPEQYAICRGRGTERAGTGKYYHFDKDGNYRCAACGQILFNSKTKFDSGSGWPSFTEPATKDSLETVEDFSHGMHRVEVRCKRCGAHLGHVFPDGPGPSGQRYCINSACLFHEEDQKK